MLLDAGKGPRAPMLGPESSCARSSHSGINQALSSAHWPKGSAPTARGRLWAELRDHSGKREG